MTRGLKWYPRLTADESRLLHEMPKAVLFVIARQFAAQLNGHCDDLTGAYGAILKEWEAQYLAGNVPQKPRI